MTLVFWKGRGLFVRNKSIVDMWFLVQHVSVVIKFVSLKRLQNLSSLSASIPAVLISILRSPIIFVGKACFTQWITKLFEERVQVIKVGWPIVAYRCPYKTISALISKFSTAYWVDGKVSSSFVSLVTK